MCYFLFLIAVLAVACNGKNSDDSNTRNESNLTEEKNMATIKKYFASFNDHDWEAMYSFYSTDALFLDPSYGTQPVTQTKDQIVKKYQELSSYIPDLKDSIISIIASGDQVCTQFVATGTTPDKKRFQLPICTVFSLENGLIKSDNTYYDQTQ